MNSRSVPVFIVISCFLYSFPLQKQLVFFSDRTSLFHCQCGNGYHSAVDFSRVMGTLLHAAHTGNARLGIRRLSLQHSIVRSFHISTCIRYRYTIRVPNLLSRGSDDCSRYNDRAAKSNCKTQKPPRTHGKISIKMGVTPSC